MTRRVVVIGGGPAGIEAAAAAAQGGARVTLVSEGSIGGRAGWDSLVPSKVWISAADLVGELHGAGARGMTGLPTPRLEPAAVLARIRETARLWGNQEARRLADLGRLDLAAAGLSTRPDGTLAVDGYGRTLAPGVYAVGDAADGPMLANRAMAQGWIAGRHAAGLATAPYRPETVVHAVYSDPEVAQVGDVEAR